MKTVQTLTAVLLTLTLAAPAPAAERLTVMLDWFVNPDHGPLLKGMLRRHGLGLGDVELVQVNFSLSPSLIAGKVDAVIGAFRNFELNQMDIAGHPGRAFYIEEEGVPPYDELIFVAHKEKLGDKNQREILRRFIKAVEQGVQFLINHPEESWRLFHNSGDGLNNELNRRAWRDTIPRFALRPAALDRARYENFAEFLRGMGVVETVMKIENHAVEL